MEPVRVAVLERLVEGEVAVALRAGPVKALGVEQLGRVGGCGVEFAQGWQVVVAVAIHRDAACVHSGGAVGGQHGQGVGVAIGAAGAAGYVLAVFAPGGGGFVLCGGEDQRVWRLLHAVYRGAAHDGGEVSAVGWEVGAEGWQGDGGGGCCWGIH